MNDEEFFAAQTSVLQSLADALIEATPEWWDEATLGLRQKTEGCEHVISNEHHLRDVVIPTDDLRGDGSARALFQERGEPWKGVVFRVLRDDSAGEESWRYEVEYEY